MLEKSFGKSLRQLWSEQKTVKGRESSYGIADFINNKYWVFCGVLGTLWAKDSTIQLCATYIPLEMDILVGDGSCGVLEH